MDGVSAGATVRLNSKPRRSRPRITNRCEADGLAVEFSYVRPGEPLHDGPHRTFHLRTTVEIALEHAHAEGAKILDHVISKDPQGLGCFSGDHDALGLREKVSDEVRDGVALTRTRRALHEHTPVGRQALSDPHLLRIRRLAEASAHVATIMVNLLPPIPCA